MKWLFNDWFEYNDDYYFFHSLELCPGKLSEINNKISYATEIDNQITRNVGTVERILSKDNMAYLFSVSGNKVVRINMKNGDAKEITIDASQEPWDNYAFITIWRDCIYIFPRHKPEAIVLKGISGDDIQSFTVYLPQIFFLGSQFNDEVWLFPENGDVCACFNLSKNTYFEKCIGKKICNLVSVAADEEDIYCFDRGDGLIRAKRCDGKIEYLLGNSGEEEFLISLTNNKIVLLPVRNDEIKLVDKQTGVSKIYSDYPVDFEYNAPVGWGKYLGYKQKGDKLCFALRSSNYALCIDTVNDSIAWKEIVDTNVEEDIGYFLHREGIVNETRVSVNEFIDYINTK